MRVKPMVRCRASLSLAGPILVAELVRMTLPTRPVKGRSPRLREGMETQRPEAVIPTTLLAI
jgi:hypothetical protein